MNLDTSLLSYYASQLETVSSAPQFGRNIQIKSDGAATKWLGLNDESATEIVKWLKEHYNIKEV